MNISRVPQVDSVVLARRVVRLEDSLRALAPVAVALSGGVDSSLLYHEARRVLGNDAVAAIGVSPSLGAEELAEARRVAKAIGGPLIEIQTHELESEAYRANRGDRCFHCKDELFRRIAGHEELGGRALCDGTNADDRVDDRPGVEAGRRLGVVSPLREAGFGKAEIRALARERGLDIWDRPARPCLASRVRIGDRVTVESLGRVEALERILGRHRFRVYRVRIEGEDVRIELGADELVRLGETEWRREVEAEAGRLGVRRVLADLAGYGSL